VRGARPALLGVALLLAGASAALAYIPPPEAVARAAADASRAQGRTRAFRFEVAVRSDAGCESGLFGRTDPSCDPNAPIARGELLVDPAGAARIELRHVDGFSERQLRRPAGLAASRDGEPLPDPLPLAPPLWLALVGTGGELLARAGELGAAPGAIALGYDGPRDCYVIGAAAGGPSVWVDKDTYRVVRVDLSDGSKVRFLAWASHAGAVLPGTIEIETPSLRFTLELTGAAPATPTSGDFTDAWLAPR
jgi:hypothetical protein